MCGIVGAAGNLVHKDLTVFKQLLSANTFRGAHSTGVANIPVSKTVEPKIGKGLVEGWDALNYKPIDSVVSTNAHILIGHGRHATRGGINRANAHPFFVEDSVVGCHNGTLEELHGAGKFMEDVNDFGTDSEAALTAIARLGAKEALEKFIGAWAFVWYDYKDNTLNFTRNDKRPLTLAYNEDSFSEIFWASERKMLDWVLSRNKVYGMKYYDIEPCTVLSFKMPDSCSKHFEDPKEWKYTEKKRVSRWSHGGNAARTAATTTGTGQPVSQRTHGSGTRTAHTPKEMSLLPSPKPVTDLLAEREIRNIKAYLNPQWGDGIEWKWVDDKCNNLTTTYQREAYVRHKHCDMCGSSVEADEKWRALHGGTLICESCLSDDLTATTIYEGGGL
jgi:hypothetical protein